MDENINLDIMKQRVLASKAFDHLLQQVQTSSLNYQIQILPFSAIIGTSVRRSSGRRSGVAVRAVDCWQ